MTGHQMIVRPDPADWHPTDDGGVLIVDGDAVALVGAKCQPCNGKGWAWDQSEQIDCPDCRGTGCNLLTIETRCRCLCHTSSDPDIRADEYLCDECDGCGITEHRVTVEAVVPIVENAAWDGTTFPVVCRSTSDRDYFLRPDRDLDSTILPLDDFADHVGRFAVICKEARP